MGLQFINKRPRGADTVSSTITPSPTPNTITGLHTTDIVVSANGLTLYIISEGQVATNVALSKIANWDISGTRVVIYSADEVPLDLRFLSPSEAIGGLSILENAINDLTLYL